MSRAVVIWWLLTDGAHARWTRVDLPARALDARVRILSRDDLDESSDAAVFRLPRLDAQLRDGLKAKPRT